MPTHPPEARLLARRYRLHTQVGRGGMGTVWQAFDEVLGRDVAVKEVILPFGLSDEERELQHRRTFREARTAARLAHPGVVTVYDVVEEDDRPWIVMELIKARSLDQVIKKDGTLPWQRAAALGGQMLSALHAAHEAGVLHRDVKPSNVLLASGDRAVLTDFGIATATGDATLTATGLVMGSPAYIAPERARGKTAGPASDLWSLGVTLYAMVEGRSPYERSEPMASLIAIITDEPPPSEKAGPLQAVIDGLLRKDPDERMTALEAGRLLDELQHESARPLVAATRPVERPPSVAFPMPQTGQVEEPPDFRPTVPAASRAESGSHRGRTGIVVAAIVLVAGLAVGGLAWMKAADDDKEPSTRNTPVATVSKEAPAPQTSKPTATKTATTAPTTQAPGPDAAPAGFKRYTDPSGYSLYVPSDFPDPDRGDPLNHYFRGPEGVTIQIGQTDDPSESALADWQKFEPTARGRFPGYELIKIAPTGDQKPVPDTGDGSKSADWEFTYQRNGGKVHALNRGFVMGDMGYAIFIMAPESSWDETINRLRPVYDSFKGRS